MKRLIVFLLLLAVQGAQAQDATPSPAPTTAPLAGAEDPAHAELRILRQHMEEAMNARNIDSLLEGVASDVVFSTMNGDVVRGKQNIRAYFSEMMEGQNARVKEAKTHFEVDELTILYPEDDPKFGIAYGHSEDQYTLADGTKFEVTPRWSAALVRDSNGWKIANFHYSVNMFDNPVVGKMKSMLALVGGVSLLVGLAIGFLIGRRKK